MIKRKELADPTSCLNKAADDEPVFVLRAKDPLAAFVVRRWALLAEENRMHEQEKIDEAYRFADEMDDYLRRHRGG